MNSTDRFPVVKVTGNQSSAKGTVDIELVSKRVVATSCGRSFPIQVPEGDVGHKPAKAGAGVLDHEIGLVVPQTAKSGIQVDENFNLDDEVAGAVLRFPLRVTGEQRHLFWQSSSSPPIRHSCTEEPTPAGTNSTQTSPWGTAHTIGCGITPKRALSGYTASLFRLEPPQTARLGAVLSQPASRGRPTTSRKMWSPPATIHPDGGSRGSAANPRSGRPESEGWGSPMAYLVQCPRLLYLTPRCPTTAIKRPSIYRGSPG